MRSPGTWVASRHRANYSIGDIELVLTLVVIVIVLTSLSPRFSLSSPIAMVVGGLVLSFVPLLPAVELSPDIVFLLGATDEHRTSHVESHHREEGAAEREVVEHTQIRRALIAAQRRPRATATAVASSPTRCCVLSSATSISKKCAWRRSPRRSIDRDG